MAAKNNASEKALRDIIIQRMLQSPKAQALKAAAAGAAGAEGAPQQGNKIYTQQMNVEQFFSN